MLCPEAVRNRANEESRISAGPAHASCSAEALHREWREARERRLSRSRTPQRQRPGVARPRQNPALTEGPPAPHSREDYEETEAVALVVRKWLLKRKDGKSLRRLIDNPAAWNAGPGVTVTSSTRSLLSGRAPRTERSTARSSDDGQGKSMRGGWVAKRRSPTTGGADGRPGRTICVEVVAAARL